MMQNDLLELAILGSLSREDRDFSSLVQDVTSLVPDYWSPSIGVVDSTVTSLLERRRVVMIPQTEVLRLQPQGRERFQVLMSDQSGAGTRRQHTLIMTVRFLLYPLVDAAFRPAAIHGLRRELRHRQAALAQQVSLQGDVAPNSRTWFDLENRRLQGMIDALPDYGVSDLIFSEAAE